MLELENDSQLAAHYGKQAYYKAQDANTLAQQLKYIAEQTLGKLSDAEHKHLALRGAERALVELREALAALESAQALLEKNN